MQKPLKIIGIIVVLAVIGAIIGYRIYNKPHPEVEAAEPDYDMTANALFESLDSNFTAADKQYLADNIIQVSGRVAQKLTRGDSVYIVHVVSEAHPDHLVNVELDEDYGQIDALRADFEALEEGAPITVKGLYGGADMEDLIIVQAYKVSLNRAFLIVNTKR